ncbi:MAG: hypothetical protein Tsb0021_16820 [Chlamydiales bacterium]
MGISATLKDVRIEVNHSYKEMAISFGLTALYHGYLIQKYDPIKSGGLAVAKTVIDAAVTPIFKEIFYLFNIKDHNKWYIQAIKRTCVEGTFYYAASKVLGLNLRATLIFNIFINAIFLSCAFYKRSDQEVPRIYLQF